jgi:HAE1 family hydrophobic/amphiphilic exporter-1
MWLTRFSIQRPIIVAMFFVGLAIYGFLSYQKLGRSDDPNVNFPIVIVEASYPGASPTEMEKLVIKPIEDQIDGIEHLDALNATAQEGSASVVVQFALDTDLNYAANDVQQRVNTARAYMPTDLDPPSVYKNGASNAMITYAISSKSMSGPALADLVNDRIVQQIKAFDNVSGVDVYGEPIREIQIEADPLRLYGSGATMADIYSAVSQNNANLPGGRMDSSTQETSVSVHADVIRAADLLRIPVPTFGASLAFGGAFATTSGNNMLLGDLAHVVDGHAEQRQIAHFNGAPAVLIDVNRTVTSDEIGATATTRESMKKIFKEYPQIVFKEVFAPADYTQASLNGVFQSLFEGVVLTAIVLMLFLHAWRNAVVVMIAIPSSLLATFIVMRQLNFTLDNVSLMALSLIIGILVDDSIVVLENITRHRDMGQTPEDAAISGRTEIGGAAIAITLVDVVVFFPLAFLSGYVGKYFVEFGIVVTVATLFSLFVSFTLTPVLAATWSVKRRSSAPPRALAWFQTGFERLTRWYRDVALQAAFRHRWLVFLTCFLLVFNAITLVAGTSAMTAIAVFDFGCAAVCMVWLLAGRYSPRGRVHVRASLTAIASCAAIGLLIGGMGLANLYVPFEFIPASQMGQISGTITFPTGTPLATTAAALSRMEQAALKVPYVDSVRTTAGTKPSGYGMTTGGFVGRFNVTLDKNHRRQTDATIDTLRKVFPPLAAGAVITVSERGGQGAIDYTLTGPDAQIDAAADRLAAYIRSLRGTTNVQTGAELEEPRLNIRIDPLKCAVLGVSPGAAATAARTAVGGVVATRVRTESGLVDVRLQYPARFRNSIDEVRRILIRSNDGTTLVPLAQIADFTYAKAPTKIDRENRQRIAEVTGDIDHSTNVTLGDVTNAINAKIEQPGFLPSGVALASEGDTKYFMEFLSSMGLSAIASFALVYMLMVILYGNFGTPFVIMFAIPVALVGAFFALRIFGQSMNLFSVIGLIMLFGLVAKNGILLADYANTLRKRGGMRAVEAMTTAAGTRLRPIIMTTAAMVFGMLPLALGLAEGGEVRRSMGVVLIGGLCSSLVLTLFLVPIAYTAFLNFLERRADRRAMREERHAPPVQVGAGTMGG